MVLTQLIKKIDHFDRPRCNGAMEPAPKLHCPQCGHELTRHYLCQYCNSYYHEVVISGIRHALVWFTGQVPPGTVATAENQTQISNRAKIKAAIQAKVEAKSEAQKARELEEIAAAKKKFEKRKRLKKKEVVPTGELKPVQLKRGQDGHSECPRCGSSMDYLEGQPVRIIDGRPTLEDVLDRFHCPDCDSLFRRIANTDYFQYAEK